VKLDVGGEVAPVRRRGRLHISGADFAHAIVEEIDNPDSPMSSTESALGGQNPADRVFATPIIPRSEGTF
jgi:hypothetical protein